MKDNKPTTVKFPRSYRGINLKWVDNKPIYKSGDEVLVIKYPESCEKITLDKVKSEPMKLEWIRACWGCRKPNPLIVNKNVYRWNDGEFTEGAEIDPVKKINELFKSIKVLRNQNSELSTKATLYNQIKKSIDGEVIEDRW